MQRIYKKKLNGSALILALFIVAIVSILATSMAVRLHQHILLSQYFLTKQRLYFFSQNGLFWAESLLNNDAKIPAKIVDPLPQSLQKLTPEGIALSANLTDAQAKFNLNNLENPSYIPIFVNLIKNVSPETTTDQAKKMAETITAKLTQSIFPNQHTFFIFWRVEQLQNLSEFSPRLVAKLKPYLTVLPEVTPININQASTTLLQSLSTNITAENIDKILADRKLHKVFTSISDWLQQENLQNAKLPQNALTLTSQYFELDITITENKTFFNFNYLLHRLIDNQKAFVNIIKVT